MDGQRRRPQRADHGDAEIGLANGASTHAPYYVRGTWGGTGSQPLLCLRWEGRTGAGVNRLGSPLVCMARLARCRRRAPDAVANH